MLEGGFVVFILVQVHLLFCSCFVDFLRLIGCLLCCDVQVLASSVAAEIWICAIVPARVMILFLCMVAEGGAWRLLLLQYRLLQGFLYNYRKSCSSLFLNFLFFSFLVEE